MPHLTPTEDALPPENPDAIWVKSDLLPDGTYVTAIHYSGDRSRILDRKTGLAYVSAIFAAAVQAEHDAAIIRQHIASGLSLKVAARTIADLRADRPPIDDAATAPLRLTPGVAARTKDAFLAIHVDGQQVGQWDPDDARNHATNVLQVLAAADLDAAYRRYLIGSIGLDVARAENIVTDLATHIPGQAADVR